MDRRTVYTVSVGVLAGVIISYGVIFVQRRRARKHSKREVDQQELVNLARNHLLSPDSATQFDNFQHALLSTPANQRLDSALESLATEELTESQAILNLLFNIAEDQSRRDGFIHRGITCNGCDQSPLCGIRYKCANCVDHDVCERCEPKDIHNKTHLFIKIRVPVAPLANQRCALFKPMYPGKNRIKDQLSWEDIQTFKKTTHFEQTEIEALYEQYKVLCTSEKGISREVFDCCLGPLAQSKNLIMDRFFKFYDANDDQYIDFSEMIRGLTILVKGTQLEKMPHAFAGYDLDNKKALSKENLKRMFKAFFLITIDLVRDVVKSCEEEMMANFDDNTGRPVSSLFSAPIPVESSSRPKPPGKVPLPSNPGGRESMWPVMEAMSQDAIDEMVDNFFKMAKLGDNDRMTYDQFCELAQVDSSLINWFDALGTVF